MNSKNKQFVFPAARLPPFCSFSRPFVLLLERPDTQISLSRFDSTEPADVLFSQHQRSKPPSKVSLLNLHELCFENKLLYEHYLNIITHSH